ncbi:APC family permease [Mycoplasmopsis agalactiae]|uniref:APC family permease n=1 Tax=Mycoplasmopsis agalactiae TaxID=2110 RepID=UPI001F160B62|nr:APC family permease [Mycoplasmopsis agalactiae]MCE6061709.1 APC family permease [Mycoplasmopsis agalactiae]
MSKKSEENIGNNRKKISFISAMLITVGSSFGAGIFFKSKSVLDSSHGSLILAIFAWIIASVAVICIALALVEISSTKSDNLSLTSWNKTFNSRFVYNVSKDFNTYVCLPLVFFFIPLYSFISLQDGLKFLTNKTGFGTNHDWVIWMFISLALTVYLLTVPALYSKVGDIQNIISLAIKLAPLIFITFLGFVLVGTNKGGASEVSWLVQKHQNYAELIKQGKGIQEFNHIGAGLGMFLAISSIFYAYDGFYVSAGIQSEMKEPSKTPMALFFGLSLTTLIYLIIAISMSINGGSFTKMHAYSVNLIGLKATNIIFGIMNIFIAIGVLGIANGFAMWMPRYIEDLIVKGDLPFWEKLAPKVNPQKPVVGIIYSVIISVPFIVIFTLIGALGYIDTSNYGPVYDNTMAMAKLYSFADLMANWNALGCFSLVALAIFGGIKNRKSNKVEIINKKKYFLPTAWISITFVALAIFVSVLVPIINLFLLIGVDRSLIQDTEFTQLLVGRLMLIIVLILFVSLTVIPTLIFNKIRAKKFGSLEKYYEYTENKLKLLKLNSYTIK